MNQLRNSRCARHERGSAAVEYAACALVFFTVLFGVIELARALFLWNTMYTVTNRAARAAAMVNYNDSSATSALLQKAMFLEKPTDKMILAGDISYEHLKIDYLQPNGVDPVASRPPCPAANMVLCMSNPDSPNCIRFVRVRLCRPGSGTECDNVPYSPLLPLPGLDRLNINMPWFSSVVPVQTLGMPGACT